MKLDWLRDAGLFLIAVAVFALLFKLIGWWLS